MKNISQQTISRIPVLSLPLSTQMEIVARMNVRTSVCERLIDNVRAHTSALKALPSMLLNQAFKGFNNL